MLKNSDSYISNICYGFNSSKFDNFLVYNRYLSKVNHFERTLSSLFYDNTLFCSIGNIVFKDVMKLDSPDTLKNKTKLNKFYKKISVGKLSFTKQNKIFNYDFNCDLNKFVKYLDENRYLLDLIKYCEYDCKSLFEYFIRLKNMFISGKYYTPLDSKYTLGGHCLKIFKEKCKVKKFILKYKKYQLLLKAQYAGISYSNPVEKKMFDVSLIDIVSQYPASMIGKELYPLPGKLSVDSSKKMKINKEGQFLPSIIELSWINQDNLKSINIIPKRTENGYDWDYKGKIKDIVLNSYDLQTLHNYGCKYKIKRIHYFENYSTGFEIFHKYIIESGKIKTIEDIKKDKKNEELRNFAKLNLNIITGKLSQKERFSSTHVINNGFDSFKYPKNKYRVKYEFNNAYIIENFKKINENTKISTYLPFAIFIYSIARQKIQRIIQELKIKPLFIETDSICLKNKYLDKIKGNLNLFDMIKNKFVDAPILVNKNQEYKLFGQYEIEFSAKKSISLAKKAYIMYNDSENFKFRFKGISKNSYICDNKILIKLYDDMVKTYKHSAKIKLKNSFYKSLTNDIINREKELKKKLISQINFELFEKILKGETFLVTISNFQKNLTNKGFNLIPFLSLKKLSLSGLV